MNLHKYFKLDDEIPCSNCPVFAICNGIVNDEGNVRLVIIGLAVGCSILKDYISSDGYVSLEASNMAIDKVRMVFDGRYN